MNYKINVSFGVELEGKIIVIIILVFIKSMD